MLRPACWCAQLLGRPALHAPTLMHEVMDRFVSRAGQEQYTESAEVRNPAAYALHGTSADPPGASSPLVTPVQKPYIMQGLSTV